MNKYKKEVLSNKVNVFTIPVPGAKTVTALLMFKTGSKYETKENSGISHFLEHMFFKGTKKRPDTTTISSDLDSLGSEFNAFTTKEFTGYWVKVASAKFKPALSIMSDMLLNSLFDQKEIDRERGVIIEELNMYEDNPLMHIEDIFEHCLYGDTPAGWDTIGTKENIRNFKREDFIKYLTTQYGANSLNVIFAGNISRADKKATLKLLDAFKNNKWKNKVKVVEKQKKPQIKSVSKKIDQVQLSLGVRTYAIGHPEEFKLKLLSVILGGAMSSRLFIRLRERNGLAYTVRTLTEFYTESGYLTTQAGVPINKVEPAIKIILEEYKRLTVELIGAKELKRAKDLFIGRVLLQMEGTDDIANWYGRQAVLRNKIITPAEFLTALKKITAQDLRKTAQKIFTNEKLNLALIGNVKEEKLKSILHF
ncbi:MAG: M16 family metallopeptidase [Patescibacteria group bacterium]